MKQAKRVENPSAASWKSLPKQWETAEKGRESQCSRLEISTQITGNSRKGRESNFRRLTPPASPTHTPSLAGSHLLNRVQPYPAAGVTRHAQVTPWGDGNRANLRSVREAGTLELLAEETAVEYLKPFKDYSVIIDIFKRNLCDSVYLIGSKSKT